MKYALVNNERVEAQKGIKGICPVCQQAVFARCGEIRVNHWAHTKAAHCDKWWEPETEWHRAWKNQFPEEWQEIIAYDEKTGEKHVADIKTDEGQVIEFQHSAIKPEERLSRELFYENMFWIIDGTRLKRDFPRFMRAFNEHRLRHLNHYKWIWILEKPNDYLPQNWLESRVPVFFDFHGTDVETNKYSIVSESEVRKLLWCLIPQRIRVTMSRYHHTNEFEIAVLVSYDRFKVIQLVKDKKFQINSDYVVQLAQEAINNPLSR